MKKNNKIVLINDTVDDLPYGNNNKWHPNQIMFQIVPFFLRDKLLRIDKIESSGIRIKGNN